MTPEGPGPDLVLTEIRSNHLIQRFGPRVSRFFTFLSRFSTRMTEVAADRHIFPRRVSSFGGQTQCHSDDFLLLEPLSDFEDLSLDLLLESDLLDDSLAFLSAAAPLL